MPAPCPHSPALVQKWVNSHHDNDSQDTTNNNNWNSVLIGYLTWVGVFVSIAIAILAVLALGRIRNRCPHLRLPSLWVRHRPPPPPPPPPTPRVSSPQNPNNDVELHEGIGRTQNPPRDPVEPNTISTGVGEQQSGIIDSGQRVRNMTRTTRDGTMSSRRLQAHQPLSVGTLYFEHTAERDSGGKTDGPALAEGEGRSELRTVGVEDDGVVHERRKRGPERVVSSKVEGSNTKKERPSIAEAIAGMKDRKEELQAKRLEHEKRAAAATESEITQGSVAAFSGKHSIGRTQGSEEQTKERKSASDETIRKIDTGADSKTEVAKDKAIHKNYSAPFPTSAETVQKKSEESFDYESEMF